MSASQLLQAALDRNSGDHYVSTQLDAARKDSILDSRNWMLDEHQASSIEHRKIGKTPGLASDVTMKATQTILTGPDADTVNEDGKAPVVKLELSTESVKPVFTYTAPANSLTVYRVKR